jgi:hypothetical protein
MRPGWRIEPIDDDAAHYRMIRAQRGGSEVIATLFAEPTDLIPARVLFSHAVTSAGVSYRDAQMVRRIVQGRNWGSGDLSEDESRSLRETHAETLALTLIPGGIHDTIEDAMDTAIRRLDDLLPLGFEIREMVAAGRAWRRLDLELGMGASWFTHRREFRFPLASTIADVWVDSSTCETSEPAVPRLHPPSSDGSVMSRRTGNWGQSMDLAVAWGPDVSLDVYEPLLLTAAGVEGLVRLLWRLSGISWRRVYHSDS